MTDSRELTPQQWGNISEQASNLFQYIGACMTGIEEATEDGQLPAEWSELYDLHRLAHVIIGQATRYQGRARDRADLERQTAPVPYRPVLTETETAAELAAGPGCDCMADAPPAPLAAEGVYRLNGCTCGMPPLEGDVFCGGAHHKSCIWSLP